MGWPVGTPHTAASKGMKQWWKNHPERRADKPNKRARFSLHFLSDAEKLTYYKLRRHGIGRDEAIRAIIAEPKEECE